MPAKPMPRLVLRAPFDGPFRSDPRQAQRSNSHSNKRSTKPNTAISRLRASPTPGNASRHSNAAHGVRETCTNPDSTRIYRLRLRHLRLRVGWEIHTATQQGKRTLVQAAANSIEAMTRLGAGALSLWKFLRVWHEKARTELRWSLTSQCAWRFATY